MPAEKCDMCHKPLKGEGRKVAPLLRPERTMTLGPECYRKERKARLELLARYTAEELTALRKRVRGEVL